MPERTEQPIMHEEREPSKEDAGLIVELVPSGKLTELIAELGKMQEALAADSPVTAERLLAMHKMMDQIKVDIGGERMTLAELARIPDLRANVEIWKEIERGDFSNHAKLTRITVKVAERLSRYEDGLNLNGLTSLTKELAEKLKQHKGPLFLDGLTSITAEVAEKLSLHEGALYLNGLNTMDEAVAERLSHHKGDLYFNGLTSMDRGVAERLSRHKGGLSLNGLTSMTEEVAEELSQHDGNLNLFGLTSMTNMVMEKLSRHEGRVYLGDNIQTKFDELRKKYRKSIQK